MGKDLRGKELGEGVSQRKDGRYTARFTSKTGKRVQKYFEKASEAKKWIIEARYEDEHNNIAASTNMTLDAWFEFWIESIKGNTIKYNTKIHYRSGYENWIKPVIGNMPLSEIKPMHCQAVINNAQDRGQKLSTVKRVYLIMSIIIGGAVDNELIPKNPVTKKVKCPKDEKTERRVLTIKEEEQFRDIIKNSRYHDAFIFILETGIRIGELNGLKWEDVDWEKKKIYIRRTLIHEKNTKKFIEGSTKTISGNRAIPLTDTAYKILLKRKAEKSKIPIIVGYHNYIFLNRYGKPVRHENYDEMLYDYANKLGIERFSVHVLRHTFATRCIEKGMKPKALQKILGHSELSMTMDLYVHVTDDELESEMSKFAKMA